MTALPLPLASSDLGPAAGATGVAPRLRQRDVRGVLVVTPEGVFDSATLQQLDAVLAEAHGRPVAIDLTECMLAEPSVLERLDPRRWVRTSADICVVCHRLSGRRLMLRTGVVHRFSLFPRVEDALRSRMRAAARVGSGWDRRGR